MKLFLASSSRHSSLGFSLVEVALAVAIAALGIITCLGLLPEGLEMSRRTAELAINSNILEQVIRDVETAGWPYLSAQSAGGAKVKKYFNDQGTEVERASIDLTYVVEIDYSVPAYLPAVAPAIELNLRRLIIRMATSANPEYDFEGKNPSLYTTFNHMVAKDRPLP
jgi:uncharacterized protein (TIGR02598 family)